MSGFERLREPLDVALAEPESVLIGALGAHLLLDALELEPEQRADDPPERFALVVECDQLTALRVLEDEQKIENADRLLSLELCELLDDPALEVGVWPEGQCDHLHRADLRHYVHLRLLMWNCERFNGGAALQHGRPPSGGVVRITVAVPSLSARRPRPQARPCLRSAPASVGRRSHRR